MALNLIFQFLFYELRNTSKVRKWFYKKLSVELDQLSKTTTGKLFEKISVSFFFFFLKVFEEVIDEIFFLFLNIKFRL